MTTSTPEDHRARPVHRDGRAAWQRRLLPLMTRMLVGLTAFFFIVTLGQLLYLNSSIQSSPTLSHDDLMASVPTATADSGTAGSDVDRLRLLASLEANVVARRYHQANVALMASIWSKYLGFMTGMTLAMVGAAFVLGQLRISGSDVSAKTVGGEVTLRSASPGLVLVVLGVVLMSMTIVTKSEVSSKDVPVYVGQGSLAGKPDAGGLGDLLENKSN
jgi:hypothetical protein